MSTATKSLVLGAIILAAPSLAPSQTARPDSAGISRDLLDWVGALKDDAAVRVATPTSLVLGKYGLRRGDSIRVRAREGVSSVHLGDVDGLWIQQSRGDATGAGILIGGAAGLAVVAIPAMLASALCADGGGCQGEANQLLVGGAAVGGLLGGLIGHAASSVPSWRQVFPTPGVTPPATRRRDSLAATAPASPPPARAVDERLLAELSRLTPSVPFRVAVGTTIHEGRFRGAVGDSLEMRDSATLQRFHLRDVDELWTIEPASHVARKAAGIGALGGALFVIQGGLCGNNTIDCRRKGDRQVALGVIAGAATGAVVGTIIGIRSPHWQRRYARWLKRA